MLRGAKISSLNVGAEYFSFMVDIFTSIILNLKLMKLKNWSTQKSQIFGGLKYKEEANFFCLGPVQPRLTLWLLKSNWIEQKFRFNRMKTSEYFITFVSNQFVTFPFRIIMKINGIRKE